ncbi:MAG: hypothetical protein WA813_03965 [Beijerinckiaceae bacterium]
MLESELSAVFTDQGHRLLRVSYSIRSERHLMEPLKFTFVPLVS